MNQLIHKDTLRTLYIMLLKLIADSVQFYVLTKLGGATVFSSHLTRHGK